MKHMLALYAHSACMSYFLARASTADMLMPHVYKCSCDTSYNYMHVSGGLAFHANYWYLSLLWIYSLCIQSSVLRIRSLLEQLIASLQSSCSFHARSAGVGGKESYLARRVSAIGTRLAG